MKKITKKQMQKLRGMLNAMDYTLTEPIKTITISTPNTQSTICKTSAMVSDQD